MPDRLFGEDFLRRLEALRLALVRTAGSRAEGLRLAGPGGGTGEFREHRNYVTGDEPRYIDWNLYGRLERLFLKEFLPEHEGRALILLDCSASMALPGKFDFARRLAAAVGYLASAGGDRAAAVAFDSQRVSTLQLRPGLAGFVDLLSFLERLRPAGAGAFLAGAGRGAEVATGRGRGAAVWISDFWTGPADWAHCAALAGHGFDVSLLRVLSPEELRPQPSGPRLLIDAETGERLVTAGGAMAARAFLAAAGEQAAALKAFSVRHGCRMVNADTSGPFEATALELLGRGRLVEPR
jgi:uncharacterized protein (DUF58 family)